MKGSRKEEEREREIKMKDGRKKRKKLGRRNEGKSEEETKENYK